MLQAERNACSQRCFGGRFSDPLERAVPSFLHGLMMTQERFVVTLSTVSCVLACGSNVSLTWKGASSLGVAASLSVIRYLAVSHVTPQPLWLFFVVAGHLHHCQVSQARCFSTPCSALAVALCLACLMPRMPQCRAPRSHCCARLTRCTSALAQLVALMRRHGPPLVYTPLAVNPCTLLPHSLLPTHAVLVAAEVMATVQVMPHCRLAASFGVGG